MGFAVIHIEKGTTGKATGLGAHIDRIKHVPNANPQMTPKNVRIDFSNANPQTIQWTKEKNLETLQTRIDKRIKAGYTGKTAIRKDAVTHLNIILTGSHLDMYRIIKDQQFVKV